MPERGVAIGAFDLVVGDMILMYELRGVLGAQYCRFIMALDTFSFRNMSIPLNNTEVAFLTGNPSFDILPMIETPSINFNISLRCEMTRGTTPHSTRKALPFPFGTSLVVVADETVGFMNGEVHALDELGMTRGATKFQPPSQLT